MKHLSLSLLAAVALLPACGREQAPSNTPAKPAAPAAAPVATVPSEGERIFKATCSLCHAAGTGGAPIPGDRADWGPRIAQGEAVLYQHAREGFTGAKGVMPPRGTGVTLSDEQIAAAVDYMVARSR